MTASPATTLPDVAGADELPGSPAELPADQPRRRRRKVLLLLLLLGLLSVLLGMAIWYLLYRQPLPALPGIPDSQLPAYSTSYYGLTKPTGVAVTPSGDRIYVTETGGEYQTKILDSSGNIVGVLEFPAETGTEHVPVYVAIDPLTEDVYVSDRPTGTIHVFNRDGAWQRLFEPVKPLAGWQPLGLAFDPTGNLYVTELRGPGQRVLVFDRAGEMVKEIGVNDGLDFPNGIDVDQAGNIWVADANNGRLLVYATDGALVTKVDRGNNVANLGLPRGVAIDGQDRVFVVDSTGNGASIFRGPAEGQPRPEFLGFFGGEGVADGEFAFPIGVAVDDRGRVYVADTANNRVQVWSY